MSDLTGKFAALEEQVAAEHSEAQVTREAINTRLDEFSVTLDTIISNNASNTRYLLAALAQIDPCKDCEAGSILVPPLGSVTSPIDSDKCKRSQAFLATIAAFCSGYDTLVSYNVVATVTLINNLISEVIAGLGAGDDIPLPSFPEATNIVGNYFSFASANIFDTLSMSGGLASISAELQSALYVSTNAGDASSAFNAVVDGSDLPFPIANLLKSTAYNALYTYFFDDGSLPDLTPYDGGICSIPSGTCYTLTFAAVSQDPGGLVGGITDAFGPFIPSATINTSGGLVTTSPACCFAGDLVGWTIEKISGGPVSMVWRTTGLGTTDFLDSALLGGTSGMPVTLPHPTGCFKMQAAVGAVIRVCKT